MFGFGVKKNKELEALLASLEMNASNNYKDAAQEDFRDYKACLAKLKESGKLKEKQLAHYEEKTAELELIMNKYTHKDQPASVGKVMKEN